MTYVSQNEEGIRYEPAALRSDGFTNIEKEKVEGVEPWFQGEVKLLGDGGETRTLRLFEDREPEYNTLVSDYEIEGLDGITPDEPAINFRFGNEDRAEVVSKGVRLFLKGLGMREPHRAFFLLNKKEIVSFRRKIVAKLMSGERPTTLKGMNDLLAGMKGDEDEMMGNAKGLFDETLTTLMGSYRRRLYSAGFVVFDSICAETGKSVAGYEDVDDAKKPVAEFYDYWDALAH